MTERGKILFFFSKSVIRNSFLLFSQYDVGIFQPNLPYVKCSILPI